MCAICCEVYSDTLTMCSDCSKNFHESCLLTWIQASEQNARDAKCPHCNATPISITRNVDLVHLIGLLRAGEEKATCPYCDTAFQSNQLLQHYDSCKTLGARRVQRKQDKFLQNARAFEERTAGTELKLTLKAAEPTSARISDFRKQREIIYIEVCVRAAVKPDWFRVEMSVSPPEASHLAVAKITYPLNFTALIHYEDDGKSHYKSTTVRVKKASTMHPLFDFRSRGRDTVQVWCYVF